MPQTATMDNTSIDRILFAVFMHENRNQGLATPLALTQAFDVTAFKHQRREEPTASTEPTSRLVSEVWATFERFSAKSWTHLARWVAVHRCSPVLMLQVAAALA